MGPLYQINGHRIVFNMGRSLNAKVAYVIHRGGWRWPSRRNAVSKEIIAHTPSQFVPNENQQDPMIWALTSTGNFTIKAAWNTILANCSMHKAVDVLTPNRSGPSSCVGLVSRKCLQLLHRRWIGSGLTVCFLCLKSGAFFELPFSALFSFFWTALPSLSQCFFFFFLFSWIEVGHHSSKKKVAQHWRFAFSILDFA